jgi:membrane protein
LSALFIFGIGVIIVAEVWLELFSFNDMIQSHMPNFIRIGRYIILTLILFLSVSIIFFYGPKSSNHWKFISPGAFVTTVLIIVSTYLFGLYISNFGQYNKLYGSIGTLLVIMLWIYINSIVLLIGFDLNASILNLKQKRNH